MGIIDVILIFLYAGFHFTSIGASGGSGGSRLAGTRRRATVTHPWGTITPKEFKWQQWAEMRSGSYIHDGEHCAAFGKHAFYKISPTQCGRWEACRFLRTRTSRLNFTAQFESLSLLFFLFFQMKKLNERNKRKGLRLQRGNACSFSRRFLHEQ